MTETTHPRRWWAALLWTLLSPAAGLLYCGRPWGALAAALLVYAVSAAVFVDPFGVLTTPVGFVSAWGLLLALLYLAIPVLVIVVALRRPRYQRRWWNRWWLYLIAAVVAASPIEFLLPLLPRLGGQPFSSPGASMAPALAPGDAYIVDRSIDPVRDLERGDAVVFKAPSHDVEYIKRLIGLPGETISIRNGVVSIDGAPLPQRSLGRFDPPLRNAAAELYEERSPEGRVWTILDAGPNASGDQLAPVTIPDDAVFVLGDHRDNSLDSRMPQFGPVPYADIRGRAVFIVYSKDWSRIGASVE